MNAFMLFLTITSLFQVTICARILGVFPIPSISHQVVYRALTMELARRGHEVTIITPDPVKDHDLPEANYKQIDVHDLSYTMWNNMFNFAEIRQSSNTPKTLYPLFKEAIIKIFDAQLATKEVKSILDNSTQQFDVLLLESIVNINFGFAWRFQVPYIGFSSLSGILSNFDAVGSPTHSVLYPDLFRAKLPPLSIFDKITVIYDELYIRYTDYCYQDKDRAFVKKHFGDDAPAPHVLESNMDMLFLNVHPLLAGVRPSVPAIVYLGGMHLKPKKKLPEDIQNFLDNSPEGVVYMSLGSNVKSKDLPSGTLQMLIEVFGELPYKVLWKYEENLSNVPPNLRTSKWLPQQDMLGHPNIKVFITQGGQQSMEEAIRDQVPLIGIPFIGDQDLNVQNFVRFGIGVGLDINSLTKKDFKEAIMTVTADHKYKRNLARLSALLSDQPMSGLERAVWWTEYVLRHGGAAHLRAPAAGLSAAQYFLLDVVAAVLTLGAVGVIIAIVLTKYLIMTMFKSRKAKMT